MAAIPLGQSAYKRSELAPLTIKNYYYERAPTNLEDQVALIPRPRLVEFTEAGAGPIRGLYRKGNVLANTGYSGNILCLSGDDLYRVHQTTGVATLIDTVEGPYRMTAEGNEDVVVLACGTKAYTTNGATLAEIAFPDGRFVAAVDALNGYFVFASELGRFYWSALGGTTVNALDYATAESQPDVLMTLKVIGDELWLFGRYTVEVWQPTGDLDLPFQRIGGRIFGIGVTGRETVQKLNVLGVDTVCWVGTDRKVWRTDPNPVPISDAGLEERLGRVEDPTTLYAHTDSWDGHENYVLQIPGEGTFSYDLTSERWNERTSYGQSLFRASTSTVGPNNQSLVGDVTDGRLWGYTISESTDGDDLVVFEHSGLTEVNGPPLRVNNVTLDCAVGQTSDPDADPTMTLEWSDDMGDTWADPVISTIGRQGERGARPLWTRLGLIRRPGRVWRWRTTHPTTVRKAKYNESLR